MKKNRLLPIIISAITIVLLIIEIILYHARFSLLDVVETDPFPFFAKYLLIAVIATVIIVFVSLGMIGTEGRFKWILYLTFTVIVLCFCIVSIIQTVFIHHEIKTRDPEYHMIRIPLKDFGITNDDEEMIFYMGRDDCEACLEIHPALRSLSQRFHVKIYYYNTLLDRDTNPAKLQEVLDKYQIKSVPTILVIRGSEILERFSSPHAADDLEKMLSGRIQQ